MNALVCLLSSLEILGNSRKRNTQVLDWLNYIMYTNIVIKFPRSRGVSGALNLQSAIAGVLISLGLFLAGLPLVSDVDIQVLRDRNLWTVSGWEQSSTKQNLSVRREVAWIELAAKVTLVGALQSWSRGFYYHI